MYVPICTLFSNFRFRIGYRTKLVESAIDIYKKRELYILNCGKSLGGMNEQLNCVEIERIYFWALNSQKRKFSFPFPV